MKLKIAQIIGLNTDQKAALVTSSVRDENAFLAVLELTCDDAFTKGRQILSELEDFYFESEEGVAERLNTTFKEAETKLSDNEFSAKGGPASGWDLCLAAISGKVLYIIAKGQVEVYLKRRDKLLPLLPVGTPTQLISGFLQEGDRLLFSTTSLTAFLGSELEKTISLPVEIFEEEMDGKIGASDLESQGLAALAVEILPAGNVSFNEAGGDAEQVEIAPLSSENKPQEFTEQDFPDQNEAVFKSGKFKEIAGKMISSLWKINRYFPRSGRGRLVLAVLLIIIVVLGAGYKYQTGKDQEKQAQFNQLLQEAKDDFSAAKGLATIAPADAKNKLDSAKDKINKALVLKSKDNEAQNLKNQIEQDSSSILQQSSISDFPVFLDMDLVKKNFRATQMSLSVGKLLLLDSGVKTLAVVDLTKKSNQILAGSEQLGEAAAVSLNGGLAFIYSKDKGILKIDTTNQKITTVAKKDADLGEIRDIYGFAGNIYVLDSGKNMIWKYLPTADSYSDKREYLTKDTKVDLSGALRMQIESSVYVLKSGGEILRFTRGAIDNFSLGGLDKGVKDPKSMFVSSDTDNLYLLDSGNSRLLILTKTGAYKGQMNGDKFATATDLAVDEKNKKVYLLDGSKIFQIDLK